jgi:hypothetical protein
MTDIGDWPKLIKAAGHYTMVPLTEYQMGNLLDALTQAQDNGDWWHELQDIIGYVMEMRGIETLTSNRGTTFTREQVTHRNIMTAVTKA